MDAHNITSTETDIIPATTINNEQLSILIRFPNTTLLTELIQELKSYERELPQHCFDDMAHCFFDVIEAEFKSALKVINDISANTFHKNKNFVIDIMDDFNQSISNKLTAFHPEKFHDDQCIRFSISSHLLLDSILRRYQVLKSNSISHSQYSIWLNQLIHFAIWYQIEQEDRQANHYNTADADRETHLNLWGQFEPSDENIQHRPFWLIFANFRYEGIATLTQWLCDQGSPQLLGISAAVKAFHHQIHPELQYLEYSTINNNAKNNQLVIYENSCVLYDQSQRIGPWMVLDAACHHSDQEIRFIAMNLIQNYKTYGSWRIERSERNYFINALINQNLSEFINALTDEGIERPWGTFLKLDNL